MNFVAIAENGKLVGFNLLVGAACLLNTVTRRPMRAKPANLAISR